MTSETLLTTLEENRHNLKALLSATDADYEMPDDPSKKAKLASAMGLSSDGETDAEVSDEERAAWLFAENAVALAAAAEEAGARTVKAPTAANEQDSGLDQIADAMGGGE